MAQTILVTGATGFIAQHVVQQLVNAGYEVIGTVRSEEKGSQLKANIGNHFQYEIVADIAEPDAFDTCLSKHPEITSVLHTASPFYYAQSDVKNNIIKPAVEGTKNVLASVKKFGKNVTRVVITSSYAAITDGIEKPTTTFSEKSWNPITWEDDVEDPQNGYRASKTFAEKAAWEFVEKEKPNFTLNTVNPVFVFGPQAFDSDVKETLNTSAEFINNLFKLGPSGTYNDRKGNFIDVRDAARAHLYALETPDSGSRFLLCEGKYSVSYILTIIRKQFPQFADKVPVPSEETTLEKLAEASAKIDNSFTRSKLGEFISLEQSVVDSVTQLAKLYT